MSLWRECLSLECLSFSLERVSLFGVPQGVPVETEYQYVRRINKVISNPSSPTTSATKIKKNEIILPDPENSYYDENFFAKLPLRDANLPLRMMDQKKKGKDGSPKVGDQSPTSSNPNSPRGKNEVEDAGVEGYGFLMIGAENRNEIVEDTEDIENRDPSYWHRKKNDLFPVYRPEGNTTSKVEKGHYPGLGYDEKEVKSGRKERGSHRKELRVLLFAIQFSRDL